LVKSIALFRQDSIQSRDSSWFAYEYAFLNGAWDKLRAVVAPIGRRHRAI